MIKTVKFSLLLFGVFWSLNCSSQNTDLPSGTEIGKPSFNAGSSTSAFGKDLVNVNLYTGIGNVNIPIYANTVDGLNVGVSLNYNTKGIKVDQIASTVGLGWELDAGGSITRQVQGSEDEIILPPLEPGYDGCLPKVPQLRGSWTGPPSLLTDACWSNDYLSASQSESAGDVNNISNPDIFTANFAGRTVKFIIQFAYAGTSSFRVLTYPKSEIRVQLMVDNIVYNPYNSFYNHPSTGLSENSSLLGFLITDEKGNKFTFKRGEYQYKYRTSERTTSSTLYFSTSKWVLTKIETLSGNIITYEYYHTPDALKELSYPQHQFQKVTEVNGYWRKVSMQGTPATAWKDGGLQIIDSSVHWRGRVTHLKSITYPNGTKVSFNLGSTDRCDLPGQKALESIAIESKYDNVVKNTISYKFNYVYFLSENWSSDFEAAYDAPCNNINTSHGFSDDGKFTRLALKSIDRIGTDNSNSEKYYSFGYNTNELLRLPRRLYQTQDLYGYYNHKTPINLVGHILGIPYHSGEFSGIINYNPFSNTQVPFEYGIDKSQDATWAAACNLLSITNGLGGKISIGYSSPNADVNLGSGAYQIKYKTSSDPMASPTIINNSIDDQNLIGSDINDGLCISSLHYSDRYNSNNNTYTAYEYQQGEQFYPGGYFWQTTVFNLTQTGGVDFYYANEREWYNSMLNGWDYPFGSNRGFKKVVVTQGNSLNEQIRKTEHEFSGIDNIIFPSFNCLEVITGLGEHSSKELRLREEFLGLCTKVTEYDNDIINPHILSTVENSYVSSRGPDFTLVDIPMSDTRYVFTYPADYYLQAVDPFNDPTKHGYRYMLNATSLSFPFSKNKVMLSESKTTAYSDGKSMINSLKYTYDHVSDSPFHFDNVRSVEWTDSRGLLSKKTYTYNYDANQNSVPMVVFPTDPQRLVSSKIRRDGLNQVNSPYTYTEKEDGLNFQAADVVIAPSSAFETTGNLGMQKDYTYDDKYYVKQTFANYTNSSFIWDHRLGQKVAAVDNAQFDEIAYSSFEGPFLAKNTTDPNKGNLDFEPSSVIVGSSSDKPITGRYYYLLKPNGSLNYDIISNVFPAGQKYLMTFWAKQSGFTVSLGSLNITSQCVNVHTINGWTLYKLNFTANNNKITISTSGPEIKMDEVRIHPAKALMSTTTYEPLLGANSSCDARNVINYYEYDPQGRLSVIRDMDGNILSQQVTVNQGSNN